MKKGDLAHLARPGATLGVKVVPRAGRTEVRAEEDGGLTVRVTAPPEDGKANKAVIEAVARALGVAKSRVEIVSGASTRQKVLRLRED